MHEIGKVLQLLGLVVVPMALFYYWFQKDTASESKLMFGELSILALGALLFLAGKSLSRRL